MTGLFILLKLIALWVVTSLLFAVWLILRKTNK